MSDITIDLFSQIKDAAKMNTLNSIIHALNKTIWNPTTPKSVNYFTDHEDAHSKKIISILSTLIFNTNSSIRLDEDQIYILLLSAYLHDIGLHCRIDGPIIEIIKEKFPHYDSSFYEEFFFRGTNFDYSQEQQDSIRKNHHIITAAWLDFLYTKKEIEKDELSLAIKSIPDNLIENVISVCLYHSRMNIDKLPDNLKDLELLILLFRVSDELDIGKHRCNSHALNKKQIPNSNAVYWYQNIFTQCQISKINMVTLHIKLNPKDYEKHKDCFIKIIDKFEEKNAILFAKLQLLNFQISFSVQNSNITKNIYLKDVIDEDVIADMYMQLTGDRKLDTNYPSLTNKRNKLNCYFFYPIGNSIKKGTIEEIKNYLSDLSNDILNIIDSFDLDKKNESEIENIIKSSEMIILFIHSEITNYKQSHEINVLNKLYSQIDVSNLPEPQIFNFEKSFSKDKIFEVFKLRSNAYYDDFENFNLSKVKISGKSTTFITTQSKTHFKPIFEKLIHSSLAVAQLKEDKFQAILDMNMRNFFLDSRSENINLPEDCFVKTAVYNRVKHSGIHIVRGRKGSGKSILINKKTFGLEEDYYSGSINIIAYHIDLNRLFNNIRSIETVIEKSKNAIIDDIKNIFGLEKTLGIIWEVFIYVYSFFIINNEYLLNNLSSPQEELFLIFLKNFKKSINDYNSIDIKDCTHHLYQFSETIVIEYIEKIINRHLKKNNSFSDVIGNVSSNFNTYNILVSKWGEKEIESYYECLKIGKKKILLTLDCFDDSMDKYRLDTSLKITDYDDSLSSLEITWLNSFYELMYGLLKNSSKQNKLFPKKLFDCLICIPHDRYLESIKFNRDSHKYEALISDLRWSGIELATMLRKRVVNMFPDLEKVLEQKESVEFLEENKLDIIFKTKFPALPKQLTLIIKNNPVSIGLFQYVLRMSFWRPRDILIYYNAVFSSVILTEKMKPNDGEMGELVKRALKKAALTIIDDEFIKEYTAIMPNILDIIMGFKNKNIILKWSELRSILDTIEFGSIKPISKIDEKFKFLYYIGFLGIIPADTLKEKYSSLHPNVFMFNEGDSIIESIGSHDFNMSEFIIHPIFINKLALIINSDDILCNFSWNYLHDSDKASSYLL
jgi:hypothetical protein